MFHDKKLLMLQKFNDIYFENDYTIFNIQNNILFIQYKEVEVDIEEAIIILRDRLKFQNGIIYPIVANVHHLISITHQARKYFATYSYQNTTSVAIVSNSFYLNLITNAYISMYTHDVPVKHFNDLSKAIQWTLSISDKKRSIFKVIKEAFY